MTILEMVLLATVIAIGAVYFASWRRRGPSESNLEGFSFEAVHDPVEPFVRATFIDDAHRRVKLTIGAKYACQMSDALICKAAKAMRPPEREAEGERLDA